MNLTRYIILSDGVSTFNNKSMAAIESDKTAGWQVTGATSVRVEVVNGVVKETTVSGKGVPACRIDLTR